MALARGREEIRSAPAASPAVAGAGADISAETASLSGIDKIRFCAAILTPESLSGVSPGLAKARASEWAKAVDAAGGVPIDALAEILPPTEWVQARLVTKRDENDLKISAASKGEYGLAYSAILASLKRTRSSSAAVEAALDELWRAEADALRLKDGIAPMLKRGERWLPDKAGLKTSHQYALDVFFTGVRHRGSAEIGPTVHSMTSGIVLSAEGDWRGGDKQSLYRSGGLSPNAGNGVIVYCPEQRRYYAYFHLEDVSVRPGQIIEAGKALGRGGNTGVNARKKGHGGHVHVEIHDADGGAWTSYAIRDLIVSTK